MWCESASVWCESPLPPQSLGEADKPKIEQRIDASIKENQKFERIEVTREEALDMFQENKFKVWGVEGGSVEEKHGRWKRAS